MGNVENGRRRGAGVLSWWAWGLTVAVLGAGCDPGGREPAPADPLATQEQAALSYNSLSYNGLSFNGLSFNGLSFNGLSFNGLSSTAFASWYGANPALAAEVMRYIVRCAIPEGQTRTYTDAQTNTVHTWTGLLGLAPGWAGGAPATEAEQQIVSACLAAHSNPFGVSVPISVLGRDGLGVAIPASEGELATFARPESCFFGNLFQGQGLYAGSQNPPLDATQSTTRACAVVDGSGMPRMTCAPLIYVGSCSDVCTQEGTTFASCTVGGVSFQPLTTRVRDSDLSVCGDGTCQVTESCGASNSYNACAADCGACP
ncbi:hypothetical protein [Corallococcus exiguus]|uniref:Uncharacterized protein n=1 Tax=Corallococcus exiguus TaxID=83462 RepID=A0A7X4Y969_9BACT|nr:hypothetical protein [Corallococcus exiguus]NBC39987.1 hypothetical protein [Corallococcus exiguus]TNV67249.1 hypothetical protein FH620_01940 [Corallococcus exiguus]